MKTLQYNMLLQSYKKLRSQYLEYLNIANQAVKHSIENAGDEFGTETALFFEENLNLTAIRACLLSARKKLYGVK